MNWLQLICFAGNYTDIGHDRKNHNVELYNYHKGLIHYRKLNHKEAKDQDGEKADHHGRYWPEEEIGISGRIDHKNKKISMTHYVDTPRSQRQVDLLKRHLYKKYPSYDVQEFSAV